MKSTFVSSFVVLTLLAGCGTKGCSTKDDTADAPGTIHLADANNYNFVGTLDIQSFETVSGADVCFDWSGLDSDLQCHDMDPASDVDNVGVVRFGTLTEKEVETALSTNDLDMAATSGYVEHGNGDEATTACLSEFSFFGTSIDLATEYTEEGGTYLLLLTSGTVPGVGARMILFLEPRVASDVTTVVVPDGCGMLDYTADLHSLTPVAVPMDGPWVMDWSGVVTDGLGNDMGSAQIDTLEIAHYDTLTVTDLENDFLDIEIIADDLWTLSLSSGKSGDLSNATNGSESFPGFEAGGVWILALRCSTCSNPAPLFLTVLEPE
jgi:hypothetical protein